ncbi:MAG: NAD kinase [Muribaculaceae bacterium]|nr:NAD kinase [Muribaculaceae bacterium]
MRILIFGSSYQKSNIEAIRTLFTELFRHGIEPVVESSFYNYVTSKMEYRPRISGVLEPDSNLPEADAVISVGGDGTFLRTANRVSPLNIPILGINTGSLGYLADVMPAEIPAAIMDLLSGSLIEETRTQLSVRTSCGTLNGSSFALNEIAILKAETASMITLHTSLNNNFLATYQSDGLIISTPTGSTAYNLSVGGPILAPQSQSFVMTPIAAHSLTMRPLVINDSSEIAVKVESRSSSYRLSVDGKSEILPTESEIYIKRAPISARIFKQGGHSFASTLRNKLMWGVNPR